MSKFVKKRDVEDEQFDWGVIGWRCVPATGAKQIVVMDVTLEPGEGHPHGTMLTGSGRAIMYAASVDGCTSFGPAQAIAG